MAEVIDSFPQFVASVAFIGRDFRHREVGLRECSPSRVYPDENLRDRFDVEILGQFDDADVIIYNLAQLFESPKEYILIHPGICCCVSLRDLEQFGLGREQLRNIRNP
jgi:hypothetical protein